jgi:hypothetical protein
LDIDLFARAAAPAAVAAPANGASVSFTVNAPIPPGATVDVTRGANTAAIISMPAAALQPQTLPPGLYKATLSTTTRSMLFEVTGVEAKTVTL